MLNKPRQQEIRIAKRVGGERNAMSGAGWRRKHDVREDGVLWEMKRTNKRSITIKADDLESVRKQALLEGRSPALGFELAERNYVILTEDDYLELRDGRA